MDTRIIRRLAYDSNYKRAIELLCDELEKQDRKIKKLEEHIDELEERLFELNEEQ